MSAPERERTSGILIAGWRRGRAAVAVGNPDAVLRSARAAAAKEMGR